MSVRSTIPALLLLSLTATNASAENPSLDQVRAAALKHKQSSSVVANANVARSGSLIFNITINRKNGAPSAPFVCEGYAYHMGGCILSDSTQCMAYEEYDLSRKIQATGSGNLYTCTVRLNYNFPNADTSNYIWPSFEVYHGVDSESETGVYWRTLAPIPLPRKGITTIDVSMDQ